MDELDEELGRLGEEHVTYVYVTALAAKRAWERAEKRSRGISVWRHMTPGDKSVQYVTALGEDASEVAKAGRLLARGGEPTECPPLSLVALRNRRRSLLIELALSDAPLVRKRVRYGEQGVDSNIFGNTAYPRNQG